MNVPISYKAADNARDVSVLHQTEKKTKHRNAVSCHPERFTQSGYAATASISYFVYNVKKSKHTLKK